MKEPTGEKRKKSKLRLADRGAPGGTAAPQARNALAYWRNAVVV
jgi:hypothetical protein